MEEKHLTAPAGFVEKSTFSFRREGGDKEVFRITPEGTVIVQGDIYEAARLFWDMVQKLAPKNWKVEKEPQGKEV